jgi:hypothetical protein
MEKEGEMLKLKVFKGIHWLVFQSGVGVEKAKAN